MAAIHEAFVAVGPRPRVFRERRDPLEYLTGAEIVERYRLTVDGILRLEGLIRDDLEPSTERSHPLSVRTKLLITLRYLSKGDFFSEVGDLHGVSRSSVSRSIDQVVSAINRNLRNITFPTTLEELTKTKVGFYKVAKIPNVIGAIDGSLIPIQAPAKDEKIYVCRKGFHAVNIQAVVDSNLRFTNINAKWPGSTHDSTVFDNCGMKTWLEDTKPGWLLGDSGYPLKSYLITPKLNTQEGKETKFNYAHSKTRVCVERAFGILKGRFRCLHKSGGCLPFGPKKCMEVVSACARLHNFCIELQMPNIAMDDEDDIDDNDVNIFQGPENRSGIDIRDTIIDML